MTWKTVKEHLPKWMVEQNGYNGYLKGDLTDAGFGVLMVTWIAVGAVLVTGLLFSISTTVDSRNCAYNSRQYQRPTHYDWFAGCYIQDSGGRFVQLDKYLQVNR